MPVRRVLGVVRPLLRDLPTPVGRGSLASRGALGDAPALLCFLSPLPGPPLTAAAGPPPWGGRHLPLRALALRPAPVPPRASAGLLPGGAWAAGPGSAGSGARGSLGARPAGHGLAGAAGGRGRIAGPAASAAPSYAALARSLCAVSCPSTASEAPCCSAAVRSVRRRLLGSLFS